jgi:hypothetical protein
MQLTKRDLDEMNVIVNKLERTLKKHHSLPTILVLSRLLPSMFCQLREHETTTDAVDAWRVLAMEMEDLIRKHFGELRYK